MRSIPGNGVHLEARQHAACVTASISGLAPTLPYLVSFEYRTVRGERARYCLLGVASSHCVASARVADTDSSWHQAAVRFDAPPGNSDVRLYLYADGGAPTKTVNEYRNLTVTPYVDEHLVMLATGAPPHAAPAMSYEKLSPALYRVNVRHATAPFVLALSDSWSNDWKVSGLAPKTRIDHLRIDGYRNGWGIDARGDLKLLIEYVPARKGRAALLMSCFGGVGVCLFGFTSLLRRRRSTLRYRAAALHAAALG